MALIKRQQTMCSKPVREHDHRQISQPELPIGLTSVDFQRELMVVRWESDHVKPPLRSVSEEGHRSRRAKTRPE